MSLNQIVNQNRKPWLDARFENLIIDNTLGINISGEINWTGPFTKTSTYNAYIVGNLVILFVNKVLSPTTAGFELIGSGLDSRLIPNTRAEKIVEVTENGKESIGRLKLFENGLLGIKISTYNSAQDRLNFRNFNTHGSDGGLSESATLLYYLN